MEHINPVIEVLPETPLPDQSGEILLRGAQDPCVDGSSCWAPTGRWIPPESRAAAYLHVQRQLRGLVKSRFSPARLERVLVFLDRPREATFQMPEELVFKQIAWDRLQLTGITGAPDARLVHDHARTSSLPVPVRR